MSLCTGCLVSCPKMFTILTESVFGHASSLSSVNLAFVLTVTDRTALFMKNHTLVSCVSLVQCLLLNLQSRRLDESNSSLLFEDDSICAQRRSAVSYCWRSRLYAGQCWLDLRYTVLGCHERFEELFEAIYDVLVMSCEEKARLLRQYDDATLAFSNAVQELRRKIGTSPKAEYERLERISNEAEGQIRGNKTSS